MREGICIPHSMESSSRLCDRAALDAGTKTRGEEITSVWFKLFKVGVSVIAAELLQEDFLALLKLSLSPRSLVRLCFPFIPLFTFSSQPGCWLHMDRELDLHTVWHR